MLIAYYNQDTSLVWVEDLENHVNSLSIGTAKDMNEAYAVISKASYTRTGNWTPAYGPTVQCRLSG